MRFYAKTVEPYGPEVGVIDITTRQNIQLRGMTLEDRADILKGLHARGATSIQSALMFFLALSKNGCFSNLFFLTFC